MTEEQRRQVEEIEQKKQLRRSAYAAIKGTPALEDLSTWLADQERSHNKLAAAEMDNPSKRSLYLQSAIVYGSVKMYLEDKLSDTSRN